MQPILLDQTIVNLFILPHYRERIGSLLKNPKRRRDAVLQLVSGKYFDSNLVTLIPPSFQSSLAIVKQLQSYGAGRQCYLLSESRQLDGKIENLEFAIKSVMGMGFATFVFCFPNKLGFYEGEGKSNRYFLLVK